MKRVERAQEMMYESLAGTQASWDGDWVLNTRMSVAAQPSEALYGNPLATAASLTEQQSALETRKDILLTSRTVYDADGRYPLHHNSLVLLCSPLCSLKSAPSFAWGGQNSHHTPSIGVVRALSLFLPSIKLQAFFMHPCPSTSKYRYFF